MRFPKSQYDKNFNMLTLLFRCIFAWVCNDLQFTLFFSEYPWPYLSATGRCAPVGDPSYGQSSKQAGAE